MAAISRRCLNTFYEWKCFSFDPNFIQVYSEGPNYQYSNIGPDNGLVPVRRQVTVWTNDG